MGGFCARSGDVEGGVERQGNGREANFGAASLVAELERNVLGTERGGGERGEREPENHGVLVNIERLFRKGEGVEFSFGIRNFAGLESGGKLGFEIGGDEIVFRFFTGVDVKAGSNFQDDSKLKRVATRDGFERSICGWRDDVAARRDLLLRGGLRSSEREEEKSEECGAEFHRFTRVPSC